MFKILPHFLENINYIFTNMRESFVNIFHPQKIFQTVEYRYIKEFRSKICNTKERCDRSTGTQ